MTTENFIKLASDLITGYRFPNLNYLLYLLLSKELIIQTQMLSLRLIPSFHYMHKTLFKMMSRALSVHQDTDWIDLIVRALRLHDMALNLSITSAQQSLINSCFFFRYIQLYIILNILIQIKSFSFSLFQIPSCKIWRDLKYKETPRNQFVWVLIMFVYY